MIGANFPKLKFAFLAVLAVLVLQPSSLSAASFETTRYEDPTSFPLPSGTVAKIFTASATLFSPRPRLDYPLDVIATQIPGLRSSSDSLRENVQISILEVIDGYLELLESTASVSETAQEIVRIHEWLMQQAAVEINRNARIRLLAIAKTLAGIVTTSRTDTAIQLDSRYHCSISLGAIGCCEQKNASNCGTCLQGNAYARRVSNQSYELEAANVGQLSARV